jgi:hypothetical protein
MYKYTNIFYLIQTLFKKITIIGYKLINMELREVINKDEWEGFLLSCAEKTFLQSWNWGDFNIKNGGKIWRLGIYNEGKLISVALIIKVLAKRGTFLFIPHGPVISESISGKDKKTILELIEQGSLYKGDESKFSIEKFIEYKKKYDKIAEKKNAIPEISQS